MLEVAGGIIIVLAIVATLFNIDMAFALIKLIFALACVVFVIASFAHYAGAG